MIIREFKESDLAAIAEIHDKFYKNEFESPDWVSGFLAAFVVTNDSGDVITAGGVRPIMEAVAVTNKDMPVRARIKALNQILSASSFVAKNCNYNQLHAFIQDDDWRRQLVKHGFAPCKGEALYLNL